jgi:predicted HTH transcriptional regulator
LLKTICGLLNAEGGTLFLGISEDRNTYKKEVEGYTLIEKAKVELRAKID